MCTIIGKTSRVCPTGQLPHLGSLMKVCNKAAIYILNIPILQTKELLPRKVRKQIHTRGACLALRVEHKTLDFRVVSSSSTLSMETTSKNFLVKF